MINQLDQLMKRKITRKQFIKIGLVVLIVGLFSKEAAALITLRDPSGNNIEFENGKILLDADRNTYIKYDSGTVDLYVDGDLVVEFDG